MDERANQAFSWCKQLSIFRDYSLVIEPLFADASFRRYFRIILSSTIDKLPRKSGSLENLVTNKTYVLLDSPPDKEPIDAFIAIGKSWRNERIPVVRIHAYDQQHGFALLEDLGDRHLEQIGTNQLDLTYRQAVQQIVAIQKLTTDNLPKFDATQIQLELSIMSEWLFPLLNMELMWQQERQLDKLFDWLTQQVISQPCRVMHRDYHCRNLMLVDDRLVIIDFQGAMNGPYVYDLVSLTSDAYKELPIEVIDRLRCQYLEQSDYTDRGYEQFKVDCACLQLQRQIKILGIFCRLWQRDGKGQYINLLPRVCQHIASASHTLACAENQLVSSLDLLKKICQQTINIDKTIKI